LIAQSPRLERPKEVPEFNRGGAHFPLVVRKPLRLVIGNRIVVLPYVGQHAQQSFALLPASFAKGTVLGCQEQRGEQAAILFDEMMAEIAGRQSSQLAQKVCRQGASNQRLAQCLHFMRSGPMQQAGP